MNAHASIVATPDVAVVKKAPSFFAEDRANSFKRDDLPSEFREASRQTGLNPFAILLDYLAVRGAPGRLSIQDYFLYRLYDNGRFTTEEKRRFVAGSLHWPITQACCAMDYFAVTEDKWLFYSLLQRFGLPTPTTLAVIDVNARQYADTLKISMPKDLRMFLESDVEFPLFFKANDGICSYGAFVVTGIDHDVALIHGNESVQIDSLFERAFREHTYLVQACVRNHAAMTKLTNHLATVRLINFMEQDGVRTPFAALKLPANGNIVDNFWRPGNILADVDIETGAVRRAVRDKSVRTEELTVHPVSGEPLVGFALPFWREVLELNTAVASMLTPIRYNTLDIGITDQGPVVVEMNSGGSMELPQLASGRGFLTDENIRFFRTCGYRFKGDPKLAKHRPVSRPK